MLIQQGRIFAVTVDEVLKQIRTKYGNGIIHIREANVQPNKELVWYEFSIEIESQAN